MKTTLILVALLSLQFLACKKNVTSIVVPEACLQANKTTVHSQDTIVFTDCSKGATTTYIYFKKEGDPETPTHTSYYFDQYKKVSIALSDTGNYKAILDAWGEAGAPIKTTEIKIRVIQ